MKLAALCCTFRRPHLLGELIDSFLRQEYPEALRELVILDDAGQYRNTRGCGWELVSVARRFATLGEKRNACAAMASPDVEGFLVADDDDIYLPHWFRTQADALRRAEWSRPSTVLIEQKDSLKIVPTNGRYHGGWAFRKDAFYAVGRYPMRNRGEDTEFAQMLEASNVSQVDPCIFAKPFYIYRWANQSYHMGTMVGNDAYQRLGESSIAEARELEIGWRKSFSQMAPR